jgi:hypothetical protein
MKLDLKINFRFSWSSLRKYSILLVPIGILLATGAIFGLSILSGRSLKAQVQSQSVAIGQRIQSMVDKTPSAKQAEVTKAAMDRFAEKVAQVEQLAKQDSQRLLLNYKIFPKPGETSQQIYSEFGETFRRSMEKMIQDVHGLDCPSETELSKELGPEAARNIRMFGGATKDKSTQSVMDAVCIKRAQELGVYANPKLFMWYGFWEKYKFEGEEQAVRDCWNTQVAYWIYEDIFTTIKALNGDGTNVFSSPVKRLVGIRFSGPVDYVKPSQVSQGVMGSAYEGARDIPNYVLNPNAGSGPTSFMAMGGGEPGTGALPWTQRTCSPQIDVIHFYVGVVVDHRSVYDFMRELCSEKTHKFRVGYAANGKEVDYKHNSITILGSSIDPVEMTTEEHQMYRYGPNAVVTLMLDCEYLFHRDGYNKIQPDAIKKDLGIPIAAPGDASGAGGTPAAPAVPSSVPMMRDRR